MSFQLIGSDPDAPDQLSFTGTEDDFQGFLRQSNLAKLASEDTITPGGPSSTTAGGPSDDEFKEWHVLGRSSAESSPGYSIISIMGAQSTGKSTVLNRIFGTQFRELDSRRGFGQTTMGIWLGDSPKTDNLLIMDLEGSDSAARKSNRENFERQVSLMALTLSEVLIINIKATEMGRATGMQLDTLKAVFEANMRLFNPKAKTLILYLFRFYIPNPEMPGHTPIEVLEEQMTRNVLEVWNSVDKPDSYQHCKFDDMFDLQFFCLPDFAFFKDEFETSVTQLRSRFTDPSDKNYYFNTDYHCRKSPLIGDLVAWSQQLWKVVVSDEDLNIPDQQKMLSAYRCEASLQEAMAVFKDKIALLKKTQKENGSVEELGNKLDIMINECKEIYFKLAHKYDSEEFESAMMKLIQECEHDAWKLFEKEKAAILQASIQLFRQDLKKQLQFASKQEQSKSLGLNNNNNSGPKCVGNFREIVESLVDQCQFEWKTKIKRATITTENKDFLEKDVFWLDVSRNIDELLRSARVEQFTLLEKEFENLLNSELNGPMAKIFRRLDKWADRVWQKISDLRIEFHAKCVSNQDSVIVSKLNNLMFDEADAAEKRADLLGRIDASIVAKCRKFGRDCEKTLITVFDNNFLKNAEGVPRDWRPGTDIEQIFKEAKTLTLSIIDEVFRKFSLSGDAKQNLDGIEEDLMTEDALLDIIDNITHHCDSEYKIAKDRQTNLEFGMGGILPTHPLQWGILLLLGWNELWSLLTNPLWLITVVFCGAIAFIAYQAHTLGIDVQSMAWQTISKLFNQLLNQLETVQKSHMQAVERTTGRTPRSMRHFARQSRASNMDDDDDEDDTLISSVGSTPQ